MGNIDDSPATHCWEIRVHFGQDGVTSSSRSIGDLYRRTRTWTYNSQVYTGTALPLPYTFPKKVLVSSI